MPLQFSGNDATAFLNRVVTRNVAEQKVGQSRYSLVCNPAGGVMDDIIVTASALQGRGVFQNVPQTRRQGIEAGVQYAAQRLQLYANYSLTDATYRFAGAIASPNNPFADANGNVQILPGNQIPAIPRHRIKASIDYSVTEAFKIGGDALYVSSQYFVGDESNQAPKLQGYTVFNLRASYQIDKTFQVYARVNNIFDNHYATYGTFFDINAIPNLANNGAPFANPDSVSPAMPRAFYAGLKATF